jgi:hypothetical protein
MPTDARQPLCSSAVQLYIIMLTGRPFRHIAYIAGAKRRLSLPAREVTACNYGSDNWQRDVISREDSVASQAGTSRRPACDLKRANPRVKRSSPFSSSGESGGPSSPK